MEVHHHAHTARKKWTHYFWEFLMLFLAVFCGFLAENQREHMIEHQREKQYIKSLVEDLKQDTTQLRLIVSVMNQKIAYKDSLLIELGSPVVFRNSSRAHYFLELSRHFPDFIYTDRTIQQLKNSGGMRLLRKRAVSDSIVDYDAKVRTVFVAQSQMNNMVLPYGFQKNKLFQVRRLDTLNRGYHTPDIPLLTQDKKDVEEFYNNMWDQRKFFLWLKELDRDLLLRGTRLIALIKKEYHLE
ncbi:MAG: hypothetical protein ACO25B_06165 [Chitinophagaceae bacterium]